MSIKEYFRLRSKSMKRFKLIPIVLASLLIIPACSKQASSKKQESGPAPSSQSSEVSSVPHSTSSNSSQESNSTEDILPDVPTDLVPLAKAIKSFEKATNYSLVFAEEGKGISSYNYGGSEKMYEYHYEYTSYSQTDYYNQYWRNYRYGINTTSMIYSELLEMFGVTDAYFRSNYQMILQGYFNPDSVDIDAQNNTIVLHNDDTQADPQYTYGGYDIENEQHYVVESGEEPGTYIGDYLNSEYSPNEAHGIEETLLANIDKFSSNSTNKTFECLDGEIFIDYFRGNAPSKVTISLDNKGNLARLDATCAYQNFFIIFKNIGGVSEFKDMPVVSRIGCEEHEFFMYEVAENGHRLCCSMCHKYMGEVEAHDDNNQYHVCKKCHKITGLEPYDDADFIKDATATNKYDRYFLILYKSSDNKLFDLDGGYWNSEIERISLDSDDNSDYKATAYFYDQAASVFIANRVSEEPTFIFDDSCLQLITQDIYLYKNITVDGNGYNEPYTIGGKTLAEYVKTVTPVKKVQAYFIFFQHSQEQITTEAPLDGCKKAINHSCARCGELLNKDVMTDHNLSFEIYTANQIKATFPNVNVDQLINNYNLSVFFKVECSKCHMLDYVGISNSYRDIDHTNRYTYYYSFTDNKEYGYNQSPFGHIVDANGVCQICGAKKGQVGNISFWYYDYDESLNHNSLNIEFENDEHIDQSTMQMNIKGNVTTLTASLLDRNERVIGSVVSKAVNSQQVFYFSIEDLANHKFEFSSSHDFGADENAQSGMQDMPGSKYLYNRVVMHDANNEQYAAIYDQIFAGSYFIIDKEHNSFEYFPSNRWYFGTYSANTNQNMSYQYLAQSSTLYTSPDVMQDDTTQFFFSVIGDNLLMETEGADFYIVFTISNK